MVAFQRDAKGQSSKKISNNRIIYNKKRGADGMKKADLREGRASFKFIWAAAHQH